MTERRKPASPIIAGSASSRIAAAIPSAAAARPARPDSRAASTTAAITAARTTDGDAPAATTYAAIVPPTPTATSRRERPRMHRPDEARDDRDVPARDRDDVARTGGREVRGEVPVDALPEADEDPRGEAAPPAPAAHAGARHPPRRGAPGGCRRRAGPGRGRPKRVEAARRAGPPEVLAVGVVVGRRAKSARPPPRRRPRRRPGSRAASRPPAPRPWPSSRRSRATWLPSRGELIDSTVARQGPDAAPGAPAGAAAGGTHQHPQRRAGPPRRRRRSRVTPRGPRDGRGRRSARRPPRAGPTTSGRTARAGRGRDGGRACRDPDREPRARAATARAPAGGAHGPTVTSVRIFSSVAAPTTFRDRERRRPRRTAAPRVPR